MPDDIKYWRGKRIDELGVDELREALADVYRQLEIVDWEAHKLRQTVDRLTNKKRSTRKKEKTDA